jgi:macrodomain Ter protein organizer (MatP/YcbG family)
MMSVKEYATDTNHTVAEILKKCSELNINVKSSDDMLSDDDVIKLTYPIIVRAKQHFNKSMSHTYIKSLAETLGTDLYKQITG